MGSEGQDLALAEDQILEEGFVHLAFEPLPETCHKEFSRAERLGADDRQHAVDLPDGKSGKLDDQAARRPRRKSAFRREGRGDLREPDRKNLREKKGLPPGEPAKAVQDASQPHVERLEEPNPGDLRLGKRGPPGKGYERSPAEARRRGTASGRGVLKKENGKSVFDVK